VSGSGICWAMCKSAPHPRQPRQHPTTRFLQTRCPSCRPTNSVKALKGFAIAATCYDCANVHQNMMLSITEWQRAHSVAQLQILQPTENCRLEWLLIACYLRSTVRFSFAVHCGYVHLWQRYKSTSQNSYRGTLQNCGFLTVTFEIQCLPKLSRALWLV